MNDYFTPKHLNFKISESYYEAEIVLELYKLGIFKLQ